MEFWAPADLFADFEFYRELAFEMGGDFRRVLRAAKEDGGEVELGCECIAKLFEKRVDVLVFCLGVSKAVLEFFDAPDFFVVGESIKVGDELCFVVLFLDDLAKGDG